MMVINLSNTNPWNTNPVNSIQNPLITSNTISPRADKYWTRTVR